MAVLASRLKGRGSEQKTIVQRRLETAKTELREAKTYRYVIINGNLKAAYSRLEAIVKAEIN